MEKRVLYGLVVMLMYLVGSCVGQGEVKLMTKEAKWEQLLAETKLPVVLTFTSSDFCDYSCGEVGNQLTRLDKTYAGKIQFFTGDISTDPSLIRPYNISSVPTVIVFKDGITETARYAKLSYWPNIYDLVRISIFGPTSGSALPPGSASTSASTSTSTSASTSTSPSPSQVGQ